MFLLCKSLNLTLLVVFNKLLKMTLLPTLDYGSWRVSETSLLVLGYLATLLARVKAALIMKLLINDVINAVDSH